MNTFTPKLATTYTQIMGVYIPKNHIYMKIDYGYIFVDVETVLTKDNFKVNAILKDFVNPKTGKVNRRSNTLYTHEHSKIHSILYTFAMNVLEQNNMIIPKPGYDRRDLYGFTPNNKVVANYRYTPYKTR